MGVMLTHWSRAPSGQGKNRPDSQEPSFMEPLRKRISAIYIFLTLS